MISQYSKISKNRKCLCFKSDGFETSLKFDYIISTTDNPYELDSSNEDVHVHEEVINIMQTYLTRVLEMSEAKNILILHLSKYVGNHSLIQIINDLLQRVSHLGLELTIKYIHSDSFTEIATGLNSIGNIEINENMIGLLFKITNKVNKTQINILQMSYDENRVGLLISKLNEVNMTKKKRNQSSKKKKGGKDITYILDEIQFEDLYYFSTFLEINSDENSIENVKEVLLNIC